MLILAGLGGGVERLRKQMSYNPRSRVLCCTDGTISLSSLPLLSFFLLPVFLFLSLPLSLCWLEVKQCNPSFMDYRLFFSSPGWQMSLLISLLTFMISLCLMLHMLYRQDGPYGAAKEQGIQWITLKRFIHNERSQSYIPEAHYSP